MNNEYSKYSITNLSSMLRFVWDTWRIKCAIGRNESCKIDSLQWLFVRLGFFSFKLQLKTLNTFFFLSD